MTVKSHEVFLKYFIKPWWFFRDFSLVSIALLHLHWSIPTVGHNTLLDFRLLPHMLLLYKSNLYICRLNLKKLSYFDPDQSLKVFDICIAACTHLKSIAYQSKWVQIWHTSIVWDRYIAIHIIHHFVYHHPDQILFFGIAWVISVIFYYYRPIDMPHNYTYLLLLRILNLK